MSTKPTLIDFFCGGGGFTEGFRQMGFETLLGVDNWEPAIKTYNLNYGLECKVKNMLDFEKSIEEIEALPDSDIIIGSPPCVTFSSSNISGKADKTLGIKLSQIFLRIVAVKKWKPDSKLKAWFMENVPSSMKHLGKEYTFEELGLAEWAINNKLGKSKVAIQLFGNQEIINSADYGSAQSRKRVISGEIIKRRKLIVPQKTHPNNPDGNSWRTLNSIISKLPNPLIDKPKAKIIDPNYPNLLISQQSLSDHFYDTGLFECEWKQSQFLKVNHPYMGRMSFPESRIKPSRTITATKIGTSREALIYKSEYKRTGDGEYRTPTVREAACIMGFPITYQFCGGETTKWRLVGNAVCPSVARAFAKQVMNELNWTPPVIPLVRADTPPSDNNLNTFTPRQFNIPPVRNKGSRFRRHPIKDGNMTITLSNYDIDKNEKEVGKWITSVQYGNGEGFPTYNFPDKYYEVIEPILKQDSKGKHFVELINNNFLPKVATGSILQKMYETQKSETPFIEPTKLIDEIASLINKLNLNQKEYKQQKLIIFKKLYNISLYLYCRALSFGYN